MIGKEIADAVTPFVMWGAIGAVVLAVLYFLYSKVTAGAVAKDDLEEVVQATEDQADARTRLKATRRGFRESFLDGWMRKPKDK